MTGNRIPTGMPHVHFGPWRRRPPQPHSLLPTPPSCDRLGDRRQGHTRYAGRPKGRAWTPTPHRRLPAPIRKSAINRSQPVQRPRLTRPRLFRDDPQATITMSWPGFYRRGAAATVHRRPRRSAGVRTHRHSVSHSAGSSPQTPCGCETMPDPPRLTTHVAIGEEGGRLHRHRGDPAVIGRRDRPYGY